MNKHIPNTKNNATGSNRQKNDWQWLLVPVIWTWFFVIIGIYVCDNYLHFCGK